jgi:hypothetical protein
VLALHRLKKKLKKKSTKSDPVVQQDRHAKHMEIIRKKRYDAATKKRKRMKIQRKEKIGQYFEEEAELSGR